MRGGKGLALAGRAGPVAAATRHSHSQTVQVAGRESSRVKENMIREIQVDDWRADSKKKVRAAELLDARRARSCLWGLVAVVVKEWVKRGGLKLAVRG